VAWKVDGEAHISVEEIGFSLLTYGWGIALCIANLRQVCSGTDTIGV